jgi:hypothetical protein
LFLGRCRRAFYVPGTIQQLDYDQRTLRIRWRVEDAQARRMPAFSVGLRLLDGELIGADGPGFHGLLKRAEISEISLKKGAAGSRGISQTGGIV